MPKAITIDKAITDLAKVSRDMERFGLVSPFRTIGKRLRKDFVRSVRKATNPDGTPWEKTTPKPLAKIGEEAKMITDKGKVIRQKIRSKKGKRAAKKYRTKYGPPLRKLKAIHRGGKFGTKRTIAAFLNTPGRAIRFGKWKFEYGYTPGTKWVEKLQFGGSINGKRVPKRTIMELTPRQRVFISETINNFVGKKLDKLARTGR